MAATNIDTKNSSSSSSSINNNIVNKTRTPSMVSAKLTFPCHECRFEAQSQRQLSRHKAVTHTQNALKCVLCPFVTAYQTNLLRHRKDVHGICGSKGNKSCKFCGFVSEDNDTLIQHQIDVHRDILKSAQVKFAKELVSAGGEETMADFSANFESMTSELLSSRQQQQNSHGSKVSVSQRQQPPSQPPQSSDKKKRSKSKTAPQIHPPLYIGQLMGAGIKAGVVQELEEGEDEDQNGEDNEDENEDDDDEEEEEGFEEYWKAGFVDHEYGGHTGYFGEMAQNNQNLLQGESMLDSSCPSTPKSGSSTSQNIGDGILTDGNNKILPATRIRRQYKCVECEFRTINPREFLYHRRDMHGCKVKIVECPYCVYACQYVQKLQRHLILVHKFGSGMSSDGSVTNDTAMELDLGKSKRRRRKRKIPEEMSMVDQPEDSNDVPDPEMNYEHSKQNEVDYDQPINFKMNFDENTNDSVGNVSEAYSSSNNENGPDDGNSKSPLDLECFICKVKLGEAANAQRHFLKHHKNADYKSFMGLFKPNPESLSQDLVVANNQKKPLDGSKTIHTCNLCDYRTRWISELERHVRVHSEERPYKCPFCNFRSKWKGDLTRHLVRYHSVGSNPELDSSDTSVMGGNGFNTGGMNDVEEDTEDSFSDVEEPTPEPVSNCIVNMKTSEVATIPENDENVNGAVKVYRCVDCNFTCNTASRFHVHYIQHVNTKPFQCSICGHRSNWEWDVTKHIKMKSQRDPGHASAYPVLIHPSGKRNYDKYDRFVVWLDPKEAEIALTESNGNKPEFSAKRLKVRPMENLLTPEVCFEVDGDVAASNNGPPVSRKIVPTMKSVIVWRHPDSHLKMVQCSECQFKHQFARVMVAHMSSHAGTTRPYSCQNCLFETNWREMIISHCRNMHGLQAVNDFDMGFRLVINKDGICRIVKEDEIAQFERQNLTSMSTEKTRSGTATMNSSLLFEQNHHQYEQEKAVIRCLICPFFTTNKKKMWIHLRHHSSDKGSLKCKYCPYYANCSEKLIRHQKLHQTSETTISAIEENGDGGSCQVLPPLKTLISCSVCTFQTSNVQLYNEHINTHQGKPESEKSILERRLTQPEEDPQEHFPAPLAIMEADDDDEDDDDEEIEDGEDEPNDLSTPDGYEDDETASSVAAAVSFQSQIDRLKNGHNKKFSYVCPECPAAFKSPGDYKIHAPFHSSNYQHGCPYCSYKARNKPQLCKHLYVHTLEYIAKRANSYPEGTKHRIDQEMTRITGSVIHQDAPISAQLALDSAKKVFAKQAKKSKKPVKVAAEIPAIARRFRGKGDNPMRPVKEYMETQEYLKRINSGVKSRCMYRCSKCPGVFTKVNTLIYHMSLHGQNGRFKCDSCDYSTEVEQNRDLHSLLHNLNESQTALGYNFNYNCNLCPAGFSKRCRLDKHMSLHGANNNWKCDKCDYSVPYAATLVKHRALHLINPDFQVSDEHNPAMEPETVMEVSNDDSNVDTTVQLDNDDEEEMPLPVAVADMAEDDDGMMEDLESPEDNGENIDNNNNPAAATETVPVMVQQEEI